MPLRHTSVSITVEDQTSCWSQFSRKQSVYVHKYHAFMLWNFRRHHPSDNWGCSR